MKRIVICCDGSWKSAADPDASNIARIAAAARAATGDVAQRVLYTDGVGSSGNRVTRLVEGAFGFGLDRHLLQAYEFLAANYEPGDEIFIFGFSRGAYTARSLVGMVGDIGLLTAKNATEYLASRAAALYRERYLGTDPAPKTDALRWFQFKCHPSHVVRVAFLGVFDTVGELGVPGFVGTRYRFHNVELSSIVDVGRHALAINERRRAFQPCLWVVAADDPHAGSRDIKQVWFTGVHTDIGGGYAEHALSDATLSWMVREARRCGIELAGEAVETGPSESVVVHDSMTGIYRTYNSIALARSELRDNSRFRGTWRVLEVIGEDGVSDIGVRVSDAALRRWQALDEADREPNIGWWLKSLDSRGIEPQRNTERIGN